MYYKFDHKPKDQGGKEIIHDSFINQQSTRLREVLYASLVESSAKIVNQALLDHATWGNIAAGKLTPCF
jgi:hypothetical protein